MRKKYLPSGPSPELIILDCDGVLYPKKSFPCPRFLLAAYAVVHKLTRPKPVINKSRSKTMSSRLSAFLMRNKLVKKAYLGISKLFIKRANYAGIEENRFLLKRLLYLQRKVKVCVFTDSHPEHLSAVIRQCFKMDLDNLPFRCFNVDNVSVNVSFLPKRTPMGFQEVCQMMNVDPSKALMMDDNQAVLSVAREAGLHTKLVTENRPLCVHLNRLTRAYFRGGR